MPSKPKYSEGEKVLCYHGPVLYEAKPIKIDTSEKQIKYLIHYGGWNKSWDEWVAESRIVKHDDAGLKKQEELFKLHSGKKGTKSSRGRPSKKGSSEKVDKDDKKSSSAASKVPDKTSEKVVEKSTPSSSRKRGERRERVSLKEKEKEKEKEKVKEEPKEEEQADSDSSPENAKKKLRTDSSQNVVEPVKKIELKISIPQALKLWLLDDQDLINNQKRLVDLPCQNSVDCIIEEYVNSRTNIPQRDELIEVTRGLREYFNAFLGPKLLYKFERIQYSEIQTQYPDKPMSEIYGSTHLLRLFVHLGPMLLYTPLDAKTTQQLQGHIQDFLKYLNNSKKLFNPNLYVVASPEYHRKASQ